MVVVADGERDVDGVASQKGRLLKAFGHVPAQRVENSSQFLHSSQLSVLSSQLKTLCFGFLFAPNSCAIWMTAWCCQDRHCGEFFFAAIFFSNFRRKFVVGLFPCL